MKRCDWISLGWGLLALALIVLSLGIVGRNDYEIERETGFRSLEEF